MKLIFFGNSLKSMLKFRWEIIEHLAKQNHKIFIISPGDTDIPINIYNHRNISFHNITFSRSIDILKEVKTLIQYKKYIKTISPDIIFSYTLKASLYSMILNWKKPNVYFITGLGSAFLHPKYNFSLKKVLYLLKFFRRSIKNKKDFFVFLNKDDKNYFIKYNLCYDKQSNIFPGEGVNLNHYKFSPVNKTDGAIKFLFIGRLIKDKGIIELIHACKQLKEHQVKFKFTLIAPPDRNNPSSLHNINETHFRDCGITYISYVKDVSFYIRTHDVVVLPSYSEGLPRVLLESMAIGRPIITTDVHGCRELVANNENGILIKPKQIDSLYEAMLILSKKTKKELSLLGLAGYKKIKESYSTSHVLNSYQQLINNILNK